MTLDGYAYEIMELLRKELTDDFHVDIRLVKEIIKQQRELFIYNSLNKGEQAGPYGTASGYDGNWAAYEQTTDCINLTLEDTSECESGDCTEERIAWKSDIEIPNLIIMGRRLAVLRILPCDCPYKGEILFSSHDRMRFSGYGRGNQDRLIASIRDNHLWIGKRKFVEEQPAPTLSVAIDGVFADPTEVPGFDEETDDFPIGKNWSYMIGPILNILRIKLASQEDVRNDARDYITQQTNS